MKILRRLALSCAFVLLALAIVRACGFDDSLREYLDARFWLPFSKQARHFERKNVRRVSLPYAGMTKAEGEGTMARLRASYQEICYPMEYSFEPAEQRKAVAAARADASLTLREREEVDLLEAKIEMRAGQPDEPELLLSAKEKLEKFARTAKTPEFLSEARGWLAYVHYLVGERTAAGKIYLDELNRDGSNLSRETLLTSLRMTYRYDGGPELLAHLEEYFDTPEHAAFAIQLVTNPRWQRGSHLYGQRTEQADTAAQSYARITALLEKHSDLLKSQTGANSLATLAMRTALRMGDPPGALKIAAEVPAGAPMRTETDFNWMLASAQFLTRQYAAAEAPLLNLFRSSRSSDSQKAAAAYALCGVYQKTGNTVEQIRFALWLRSALGGLARRPEWPTSIEDQSVYWAVSGFDLGLLLDAEAPREALESFLDRYPNVPDVRLVRYALAVRLTRESRYEEAARIYEAIGQVRRAPRMRRLVTLHREANRTDLAANQIQAAKYRLAEFIVSHPDGIYFNDSLWHGYQRYALFAEHDSRLTREERDSLMEKERKLKDEQEERWRAFLILSEVVRDSGKNELGRRAARLAVQCLRGIHGRFEREDEIRKADTELSNWLRE